MSLTPQITLTGTLGAIFGGIAGGASLSIALVNFGVAIPVIPGTAVIAGGVEVVPLLPAGTFSLALWGNDVISPAGTYYAIALLDAGQYLLASGYFVLDGSGSFNLAALTPYLPLAPPAPPVAPYTARPAMQGLYQAVDREAIWAALFAYLQGRLTAPPWATSTVYAPNALCTDPSGHLQLATIGGISGTAPPPFADSADGLTPDAQMQWEDQGAGFVSMGRKHKPPPDLGTAEQPALFLIQVKETHMPKPRGVPTKLALHGMIIIYLQAPVAGEPIGQETVLAAAQLNDLYRALDTALEPDNVSTGVFTLGGLLSHCWIEGDTDQDPGIFGSQAAAILPIHILVP